MIARRTRTAYDGPLVVGTDPMSFVLGKGVTIENLASK